MTPNDHSVAQAVFIQLIDQARSLTFSEMMVLKAAYSNPVKYKDLPEPLQRKLRDIGLAARAVP